MMLFVVRRSSPLLVVRISHFCGGAAGAGRRLSSPPHVAIVGSGPAGFYTAQQLLKSHTDVRVDLYEKLPVPYGLVRYGVAPDHPEVKNVINTFAQTASHDRVSFLGNVCVGDDVSLERLREAYTAVVLAYGAEDDKRLGIPGESLRGVHSARAFVGWYNGSPEHAKLTPDLNVETVVVLGQGNVALDVARVLLSPIDRLKETDIAAHALAALSLSRVRRVALVGRRGPLQVAFTTAELRQMLRLPDSTPRLCSAHFSDLTQHIDALTRPRRRLLQLMMTTATSRSLEVDFPSDQTDRTWELIFNRSPIEFLATKSLQSAVCGVRLSVNELKGPADQQVAVATGRTEIIDCGLVVRSVGYRSGPLEAGAPFNHEEGVVPNRRGRVLAHPGLYCSGWVKRGPIGVINSTMVDAFETGRSVADDLIAGELATPPAAARHHLRAQLGVKPVTFSEWEKIDRVEKIRGELAGKTREKCVDVAEMLRIAKDEE